MQILAGLRRIPQGEYAVTTVQRILSTDQCTSSNKERETNNRMRNELDAFFKYSSTDPTLAVRLATARACDATLVETRIARQALYRHNYTWTMACMSNLTWRNWVSNAAKMYLK